MPEGETKLAFAERVEFEKLDAKIAALERLHDERFRSNAKATELALTTNNERLDHMNKFREALTDTTNRMITRVEALNVLEANAKKIDSEVDELRSRLEEGTKPNYPFIIGILSTAATVMTGMWLIIGLKIDNTVSPIEVKLASLGSRIEVASTQITSGDERINLLRLETTQIKSSEIEIETQFCASDIVRNLNHATDMRIASQLWKKTFNEILPTDNAYYPQICSRPISAASVGK